MILTNEQINAITNENGLYEWSFVNRRFSHLFFNENISPIGNIIAFEAKAELGPVHFNKALILCGEIINTSMFGGVCFQRLYSTQLGSLLSVITGKRCIVDASTIIANEIQATIAITNRVNDSVVFHIVFPIETSNKDFDELNLSEKDMTDFKINAVESFKHLTKSIFVETQYDNF